MGLKFRDVPFSRCRILVSHGGLAADVSPRGSKYPIFEVSDPKNHTLNGIWGQSPEILGTWTL